MVNADTMQHSNVQEIAIGWICAAMIEKLSKHTCNTNAIVVLDGGIATAANLKLITEKGYKYLCVSRTPLKEYQTIPGRLTVLMDNQIKENHQAKASYQPNKYRLLSVSTKP